MSYEIQVSTNNPVVTSSSTEYSVTVQSPATANFTITNNLSTITVSKLDSTTTIYTDAVELVLADLNDFWRGEWSAGNYIRGDIVTYQYSQYFLDDFDIDPLAIYNSTTPPPDDSTWIRFNWHEAPFAVLTVTNTATFNSDVNIAGDLTIGGGAGGNGLTINSTATFNGLTFFNSTATFNSGINLPNADLELSSIILNGKNLIRTKNTGTATLSIGISEIDTFRVPQAGEQSSRSFNIFSNGRNTRYADNNFIDVAPGFRYPYGGTLYNDNLSGIQRYQYDNDIQLTRNYGLIEVNMNPWWINTPSTLVNALSVNTASTRISAGVERNNQTADSLNDYGLVDYFAGYRNQEIIVSSTGTNTLTNYIFLSRDGIEQHSYSGSSGGTYTKTRKFQTQNKISFEAWYPNANSLPWNNSSLAPAASLDIFYNRRSTFDSGRIVTTSTNEIHTTVTGGDAGGNNGFYFAPKKLAVDNVATLALGHSIDPSGLISQPNSIFYARWTDPVPSSTYGISYIYLTPDRVFINPTEYVWFDTPYIELRNSTYIKFADATTQNTAWQGYDQGPLASSIPSFQLRRGALAEIQGYTPDEGELVYSTNTNKLYVGDGVTAGGILVSGGEGQDFDFGTILTPAIFSLDMGTF